MCRCRMGSTSIASGRAAGAVIVREPEDQFYGDRVYSARDPEGHVWSFGQSVRKVSREAAELASGLIIEGGLADAPHAAPTVQDKTPGFHRASCWMRGVSLVNRNCSVPRWRASVAAGSRSGSASPASV